MKLETTMSLEKNNPHQIDPDGDLILFTPGYSIETIDTADEASFLVSSKHLKLASPYFKILLSDSWPHGKALATKGTARVAIKDCRPTILLLILNIIHGHTRKIPREVSFQQLADFSVATDFFQCHEVVEVFASMWIKLLKPSVPATWMENTKWIMIASVFKVDDVLKQTTEIAMKEGTGPLLTNSLPIPVSVKSMSLPGGDPFYWSDMVVLTVALDDIDNTREKHLQYILCAIEEHIARLLHQNNGCNPQCDATYLGLLLKRLATTHIFLRLPSSQLPRSSTSVPLEGKSLLKVISVVVENKPRSTYCTRRYACPNRANPWGSPVETYTSTLQIILQAPKIPQSRLPKIKRVATITTRPDGSDSESD